MAILFKNFTNHFGLDLRSSDINRDPNFVSGMKNAQYRKNGNVEKRAGQKAVGASQGGFGLGIYRRIDPTTSKESEILVTASNKLHRLLENSFTVTYSGAETSVIFELFYDDIAGEFKAQITENTTLVLDEGLGVGFDEASIETLAGLKTTIDAITDFSATITGDTSTPASFLDFVRSHNLADGPSVTKARYWSEINSPSASPLAGSETNKNDEDFENTSFAQLNNVLFVSNGYDEVHKYDGQNFYRAGMPQHGVPSVALGGAGALTGTYRYKIVYAQKDAVGNIVEGNISTVSSDLTPAAQDIDVTLDNILAASGFNTNCAIVAGAQVTVTTITVDDGAAGSHTMKVGDTAYFFDSVSGGYVEREVTAIAAGTITIAGASVTVADNAVISNNLRIGIYRNQNGGTFSYLVEEVPNNSFTATQTYTDSTADGSLGIQLLDPINGRDLPPKGRYIAPYNNQLFITGNIDNKNLVYWSGPEAPENFAQALFNIKTQSVNADAVTGLRQDNEVMAIFEKRAIHIISGDIPNNNIRVDVITAAIGCVSNHSIDEVKGSLYFLSDRGVWRIQSGQTPEEMSPLIEPVFDVDTTADSEQQLVLKRSVGVNNRDKEQYVLYVPAETTTGGDVHGNSNARIFTQDYFRGAWLEWDTWNMLGGAVIYKDQLFFQERRYSTFNSSVDHILYNQQNRGDNWDYQDNTLPVSWEYDTSWYHFGEPSVFKKFLRLKAFSQEETEGNAFIMDVDIERDFTEGYSAGNITINFEDDADGYGVGAYGTGSYGDQSTPNKKVKIGPIKSQALRFKMSNTQARKNVNLTGWEVEFASSYRMELKE